MKPLAVGSCIIMLAVSLMGCEDLAGSRSAGTAPGDLFPPTAMRLHPGFTEIAYWTHSLKPDGIEANLEFTDQFDDPTKASGRVLFELYEYRRDSPDPRGKRLGHWVGSLETLAEQRERWNTTLRNYSFKLDFPNIDPGQTYVISAIFELTAGGRFFNQIVLPGKTPEKNEKKHGMGLGVGDQ